ncbi:hypothetical protein CYMTET_11984 [Cymbomonas tetramitiformis]|uniref:Uncharacterized protein n=1 Tax=Cymbomonas tetramitiformis TaxID=36881 RepID=A0AAE0GLH1_9CHLO|nr:hypothetical protein CYMTET_11984 [Cymbomonas tetramitiformis]
MDLTGEGDDHESDAAVKPAVEPRAGPTSRSDVRRHGVGRQVLVPVSDFTDSNPAVTPGASESNPTGSNPAVQPGARAVRASRRPTAPVEPVLNEYELQREQNIARNKSRLDGHLEVVRAAIYGAEETSDPPTEQTLILPSDLPLSETSDPPLSETSDPPLSETSDPPVMHDLTIHLQDPDQVVAAFTAPARTGRTTTTRPTSIPLPSVVSEHGMDCTWGSTQRVK